MHCQSLESINTVGEFVIPVFILSGALDEFVLLNKIIK